MEAIERTPLLSDWITFVFVFGMILLTLMKAYSSKQLQGYSTAFFTQSFMKEQVERNVDFFSPFHFLLFFFTTIVISLTFCIYFPKQNLSDFFLTLVACISYFVIQGFINFFIQKVFNIREETRYFLLTKMGYLYTVSIWVFPFLIVYQYTFNNLFFLYAFILILLLFRGFLILSNNKNIIFSRLFYFILYFCTLELAPLLILYKITTV